MKSFLFLAFCLLLVSCQNAGDCPTTATKELREEGAPAACTSEPDTNEGPTVPDSLPAPDGDVPDEAFGFDASIRFHNFEVDQEEKVHRAIDIIKRVVASSEFRTKVLTHSYKGKPGFVDSKLTNEEIYRKILEGSEKLVPGDDYEMDMELELYYSSRNTVGYTYPNTVKIWMNKKYFVPFTPAQVAGNIFHEWTHKLGFSHAVAYSASRDASVPYAIGYMIRDLGKKYE